MAAIPRGGKWTIRPNVASGGLASALVTLAVIFGGLLQGGDLDETRLKALTGALAIVLPVGFAYFAPADRKTPWNAIGGVVAVIASAVIALAYGLPAGDSFQTALLDALAALASVAFTGYVANTKPEESAGGPVG